MIEEFTITAFSENHIGLLNRITIIFTRRHVNIESLTVCESAIKGISKFTIVVNETREKVEKICGQIEKLTEVLKCYFFTESEIIHQEIALYKVPTTALLEGNMVESIVRKHNARIMEVTPEYTVIEKTGHKDETQELFEELNKYGVKQFTRSGRIAVNRLNIEPLTTYLSEIEELRKK